MSGKCFKLSYEGYILLQANCLQKPALFSTICSMINDSNLRSFFDDWENNWIIDAAQESTCENQQPRKNKTENYSVSKKTQEGY